MKDKIIKGLLLFVFMFSFLWLSIGKMCSQDKRMYEPPDASVLQMSQDSEANITIDYLKIKEKNNLLRLEFQNENRGRQIGLTILYDPSIIKLDYNYAPKALKQEPYQNSERMNVENWVFKNHFKNDYKIINSHFSETEMKVRFFSESNPDDVVEKVIKIIGQKPRIIPTSNLKISNNSLDFDELTFTDSESLSEKCTNVIKWQGCDSLPDGENLWLDISFDDTTGMLKCGKVLVNNKPFYYNKNEKNIIIGLGREKKEISVETFISRPKIIKEGSFSAQAIIALKSDNPTIQFEGNESRQELEPVKYTWRIKRDEGVVFGTLMIFIIGIVVILGLVAFAYTMKNRNSENRRKGIQNPSDEDEDYYESQRAHDGYSNKEFDADMGTGRRKKKHERTPIVNESQKPYLKITPNPVEFKVPAFSVDAPPPDWWVYGCTLYVDLKIPMNAKPILKIFSSDDVLISQQKTPSGHPRECSDIDIYRSPGNLMLHVYARPGHIGDENKGIIVAKLVKPGNWRKRHEEIDMQEIKYRWKTVEEDSIKHQSSQEMGQLPDNDSNWDHSQAQTGRPSFKQDKKLDKLTLDYIGYLTNGPLTGEEVEKWAQDSVEYNDLIKKQKVQVGKSNDDNIIQLNKELREKNNIIAALRKQLDEYKTIVEKLPKNDHDSNKNSMERKEQVALGYQRAESNRSTMPPQEAKQKLTPEFLTHKYELLRRLQEISNNKNFIDEAQNTVENTIVQLDGMLEDVKLRFSHRVDESSIKHKLNSEYQDFLENRMVTIMWYLSGKSDPISDKYFEKLSSLTGIKKTMPKIGTIFDPAKQEINERISCEASKRKMILEVIRNGIEMNGKVYRKARVNVGRF